jgi:hypothetical protein
MQIIQGAAVSMLLLGTAACTGGQILDASGNAVHPALGTYTVTFEDSTTHKLYETGVDTWGHFSFDMNEPQSSLNNASPPPVGYYFIQVKNLRDEWRSPNPVQVAYPNSNCGDYNNPSIREACALFELKLLADKSAGNPSPLTGWGYTGSLVPLNLVVEGEIGNR